MDARIFEKLSVTLVGRRAGQFSFLKDIVRIDTTEIASRRAAADKIAGMLEALEFDVERHTAPDDIAPSLAGGPPTNLIIRKTFGDGPTVALVSHLDTVHAGDGWRVNVHGGDIKGGSLYGRGSVSGKGHFAAQVFALRGLMDMASSMRGSVEIHASFDGEQGGNLGARWLLEQGIVNPDAAIVGGPAQAVVTAGTGTMIMDVEVRGEAAPAYAPERGCDALSAANAALARLFQLRTGLAGKHSDVMGLGAPTMVVTHIEGGAADGGVPGVVKFRIDRRILPEEDPAQIETQLTNLVGGTVAKTPGARCRIRRSRLIPPMVGGEEISALEAALTAHLQPTDGEALPVVGVAYDHEGRHYTAHGVPTVLYGAGPLDPVAAGMHGPDEHVRLDDLRLGTEVLARAVLMLLDADASG